MGKSENSRTAAESDSGYGDEAPERPERPSTSSLHPLARKGYEIGPASKLQIGDVFEFLWADCPEFEHEWKCLGYTRFIVLRHSDSFPHYCTCVPISIGAKKDFAKPGIDILQQGYVYASGDRERDRDALDSQVPYPQQKGLPQLPYSSVGIHLRSSRHRVKDDSRANYADIVEVDHEAQVMIVGDVARYFDRVRKNVNKAFMRQILRDALGDYCQRKKDESAAAGVRGWGNSTVSLVRQNVVDDAPRQDTVVPGSEMEVDEQPYEETHEEAYGQTQNATYGQTYEGTYEGTHGETQEDIRGEAHGTAHGEAHVEAHVEAHAEAYGEPHGEPHGESQETYEGTYAAAYEGAYEGTYEATYGATHGRRNKGTHTNGETNLQERYPEGSLSDETKDSEDEWWDRQSTFTVEPSQSAERRARRAAARARGPPRSGSPVREGEVGLRAGMDRAGLRALRNLRRGAQPTDDYDETRSLRSMALAGRSNSVMSTRSRR